ncbi:MAG: type I-E CRISPR-associated protein Cas6/Cse3/CasE [Aggregatilineales bacterium]
MSVFLSRLFLNNQNREVRRDLGDCHQLHNRILKAFGTAPAGNPARDHFGVLFRPEPVEGAPGLTRLLVQSNTLPDWGFLSTNYLGEPPTPVGNPSLRTLDADYAQIERTMPFIFRLRANSTKRVSDRSPGRADALIGKRVELLREVDQIAWLHRKGEQHGFRLLAMYTNNPDVRAATGEKTRGRRSASDQPATRLTFGTVVFNGRLEVTNRELFLQALIAGIGSGKAFGFGLLSVASVIQ